MGRSTSPLDLAIGLAPHWEAHGQFVAGRETLESALASSEDPSSVRAEAHGAIATLAMAQGDVPAARRHLEIAIELHDLGDDGRAAVATANTLSIVLLRGGHVDEAEHAARSAFDRAARLGDERGRAFALTGLGLVAASSGRLDDAFRHLLTSLQIFRASGANHEAASVLANLGNLAHDVGDRQRSARFYDGARQLFDGLGDRRGAALCLNNLALLAHASGDVDHAVELGRAALDHFSAVGDLHGEAAMLNNLAGWWASQGALSEAATLYEQAIARFEKLGDSAGEATAKANLGDLTPRSSTLSERQMQVAGLVSDGLTNREIAEQLFISERTVHSHLSHIFTKLGLSSRTQVALWADRQGVRSSASVTLV
jgi:DNA-binding CsgD family transcriptional regulator/Tfp pilus assembly protein PilF